MNNMLCNKKIIINKRKIQNYINKYINMYTNLYVKIYENIKKYSKKQEKILINVKKKNNGIIIKFSKEKNRRYLPIN